MHPDDITVAARTMTEAEPPADLEQRIMQRLDDVTADARGHRRLAFWLVPTGVAVALIAVVLVPRFRTADVPVVQDVPQSTSAAVIGVPEDASPEVVPDIPARTARVARVSSERPAMSDAELAWMARRIPALDPIETITVDQIVLDTIQPETLLITPLTMTPLVTSPMFGDPDAGR